MGAWFIKFRGTAVMLQIRDSFPPPTWCVKCQKYEYPMYPELGSCIKTGPSSPSGQQAKQDSYHGDLPEVPQGGLLCGCAAVTSETRPPTLKACHGSSNPCVWDMGRWVWAWGLCLHPPGCVNGRLAQLSNPAVWDWPGDVTRCGTGDNGGCSPLQTIFYRAQTRSWLCLRNYNGKENWWHLIQYLCRSSVCSQWLITFG